MSNHLSEEQIIRFAVTKQTPESAVHIAGCSACHDLLVTRLNSHKLDTISFSLHPAAIFNSHLPYEQLIALSEQGFDEEEFQIANAHLEGCSSCREDLFSLIKFRKEIASQLDIVYDSNIVYDPKLPLLDWWAQLSLARAAAIALIALLILGTTFLAVRTLRKQSLTTSVPVEVNETNPQVASIQPAQIEQPRLILKDGNRQIALGSNGHVSGLDDLSPALRATVAQALRDQNITVPKFLKQLNPTKSRLRGSADNTFKLLSPIKTVIADPRPNFKWEHASGASSYTVYVLNINGDVILKSDRVPQEQLQWKASKSLPRDRVYSWSVSANVGGKEIISPGPDAPEARFYVISKKTLSELNNAKQTGSHLALALTYMKAGMLTEGQKELQLLKNQNQESPFITSLLETVSHALSR